MTQSSEITVAGESVSSRAFSGILFTSTLYIGTGPTFTSFIDMSTIDILTKSSNVPKPSTLMTFDVPVLVIPGWGGCNRPSLTISLPCLSLVSARGLTGS